MKRTSLFVALASALSLSAAYAQSSQDQGSQSSRSSQQQGTQQQAQGPEVVKQVQEKLSAEGHQLTPDGKMGPKTQAALKEYQQKNGLQATGQIDQETLAKLGIESGGSAATGGSSSQGSHESGSSSSGSGSESSK